MTEIRPLRLLLKTAVIFILANLLFAAWNPPVGRISIYNTLLPGRTRFPFGEGIIDSNITVDDMDAMFASHVISAPKAPGEYRVVIIGDSSIWGTLLRADETLDAQLNRTSFACAGKKLRFYNLGYPHPSVLQDLYILNRALQYQPDMVIWPVTPNSLRPKPLNTFLMENYEPVKAFIQEKNLDYSGEDIQPQPPTFFERTLIGQRNQLSRLFLLQSLALPWASTSLDMNPASTYQKLSNDLSSSLDFGNLRPGSNLRRMLLLNYLKTGVNMSADVPVLFVNEPMYLPTGKNTDKRYNVMVPRWAYDQYRLIMSRQMPLNGWHYADLWNIAPPQDFTDYELHLSPHGEQLLATALKTPIQKIACP